MDTPPPIPKKSPPPLLRQDLPIWKVSHKSYSVFGWLFVFATALATVAFAVFQIFVMIPLAGRLLGHSKIPGLAVGAVIVTFGVVFFVIGDRVFNKFGIRLIKAEKNIHPSDGSVS